MSELITSRVVVVGAGPAGLLTGLLLARAGVDTVVLEKHADFLRDFRGDTVHPSTQQALSDLGLLNRMLAGPHRDASMVRARWQDTEITIADFRTLPVVRPCVSFVPQWDLLEMLASSAAGEPDFRLIRTAPVTGLLHDGGRVVGVRASHEGDELMVQAELVIVADGRDSVLPAQAGLRRVSRGAPMDVLWFRVPRRPDETYPMLVIGEGLHVMIDRGDFYQVAQAIPVGAGTDVDMSELRRRARATLPGLAERFDALTASDVRTLRVGIARLRRWWVPGMVCIGDAAHTMSPAGGVGINLAIQDAIATANLLAGPLRSGTLSPRHLRRLQRRRQWPARMVQAAQQRVQGPMLFAQVSGKMPLFLRVLHRWPVLTRVTGRVVGLGLRPERVRVGARAVPRE